MSQPQTHSESEPAAQASDTQAATEPTSSPQPAVETVESLREQLAAAMSRIAELEAVREVADAVEILIREKMKLGLSRQQAEAVIRRQREFDRSDLGRIQAARHAQAQSGN
jgi:hypothetical protein